MAEVITLGETMGVMAPDIAAPLRYVHNFRLHQAGAESNFAIGICKLGHSAEWLSRLGDDEIGAFVNNSIRAEGVDTSGVVIDSEHRTGLMLKQTSSGETSVFYYRENSAASCLVPEDIPADHIQSAKILHLTGITPVLSVSCLESVKYAADIAGNAGIPISFDPNIRKKLWKDHDYSDELRALLYQSTYALLGIDEASFLLDVDNPDKIIEKLLNNGVKKIALKDGARGAIVADSDETLRIAPYTCKCIDPIGAGDAFNAAFISGILEKRSLIECGTMGAIAGALATETIGDIEGFPSRQKLDSILKNKATVFR